MHFEVIIRQLPCVGTSNELLLQEQHFLGRHRADLYGFHTQFKSQEINPGFRINKSGWSAFSFSV